jgi:DNA-binding CsgD family transcriptional regulator
MIAEVNHVFPYAESTPIAPRFTGVALNALLVAVLDELTEPLFLLDKTREVVFANATARRIAESTAGFKLVVRHFSTGCRHADRELDEILESMSVDAPGPATDCRQRGMRVSSRGLRRDWMFSLRSLPALDDALRERRTIFILQAHSRVAKRGSLARLLSDWYGATPAESAAAAALLSAGSTKGASHSLNRSHETVRSHLKALFRRCDVHSKTELAALLWAATLFAGDDARHLGHAGRATVPMHGRAL